MITAYSHSTDKESCLQKGADEFLEKPINIIEL